MLNYIFHFIVYLFFPFVEPTLIFWGSFCGYSSHLLPCGSLLSQPHHQAPVGGIRLSFGRRSEKERLFRRNKRGEDGGNGGKDIYEGRMQSENRKLGTGTQTSSRLLKGKGGRHEWHV